MLKWTLTFFVIAIIAAVFGYGQIEGPVAEVAQLLFLICLPLSALAFFGMRPKRQ